MSRALPVALSLLLACHRGAAAGEGAVCDEAEPCRAFLACVNGRCERRPPGDAMPGDEPAAAPADAGPDGLALDGLPPSATAPSEPSALPGLHHLAITSTGRVVHWAGKAGSLTSLEGGMWGMEDLTKVIPGLESADDIEALAVGHELHVLFRRGDIIRTAAFSDRVWTPLEPLPERGSAMGLANVAGELWACVIGTDGRLRLLQRPASGEWNDLGDVSAQAIASGQQPGPFARVDCVGMGAQLFVVAVDGRGQLWSATRRPDDWERFSQVLNVPLGLKLIDVDVVNADGELGVLATTDQGQYLGFRAPSGEWTTFDSVDIVAAAPPGAVLGGAQVAVGLDELASRVTEDGEVWMCIRDFARMFAPYWRQFAAPPGERYVAHAMALEGP